MRGQLHPVTNTVTEVLILVIDAHNITLGCNSTCLLRGKREKRQPKFILCFIEKQRICIEAILDG
jgi:hypothetical protein